MGYIIIYILIYPIFWLLAPWRKKGGGFLVIQSAKIGDYINTTALFAALKRVDVAIDSRNLPFAEYDNRIERVYLLDRAKRSLFSKIGLGLKLYLQGYNAVFVAMPNSYNLFIAKCSKAPSQNTLKTYATKWYERVLMSGMRKVKHTKTKLTLQSYIDMYKEGADVTLYPKSPFEPLFVPHHILINHSDTFKVGITLGAGNRIKVMPLKTWIKILNMLDRANVEIYVFGAKEDEGLLEELLAKTNFTNLKIDSLIGKLQLNEIPYHISKLNMFISSDTGLSYIADSYNLPLINFAGPCYMREQRPIGKRVLIVESNAECVPFSFIFDAPYQKKCEGLYDINSKQQREISRFIEEIYRGFQSFLNG